MHGLWRRLTERLQSTVEEDQRGCDVRNATSQFLIASEAGFSLPLSSPFSLATLRLIRKTLLRYYLSIQIHYTLGASPYILLLTLHPSHATYTTSH
jgi:hypothetical protein